MIYHSTHFDEILVVPHLQDQIKKLKHPKTMFLATFSGLNSYEYLKSPGSGCVACTSALRVDNRQTFS